MVRLARLPEAHRFILRGGMLLRHWVRPFERPAADLDLVSTAPFDVKMAERQLRPLLSDDGVDDGLAFNQERYRVQGIWLDTDFPGVRMIAFGVVDGVEYPLGIDVTYGESLVPPPLPGEYPIRGAEPIRIQMCQPEAILARKLHALWDMGMRHWRPKDLNDIRLLLSGMPINGDDLGAGIEYSFTSRGDSVAEIRTIFDPESWWATKTASARWNDFVAASSDFVPSNLTVVVTDVGQHLRSVLRSHT